MRTANYLCTHSSYQIQDPTLGLDLHAEPPLFFVNMPSEFQIKDYKRSINQVTAIMSGDILSGEYIEKNHKDQIVHKCFYKDNLLHGPSYYYDLSGGIISESWWIEGQRQGISKIFEKGILVKESPYLNNFLNGIQKAYWPSGQIKSTQPFVNNFLEGSVDLYYANGQRMRSVSYHKSIKEGIDSYYHSNGQLFFSAQYHKGQLVDSFDRFNPKGNRIQTFKPLNKGQWQVSFYNEGKLSHQAILCDQTGFTQVESFVSEQPLF